VRRHAAARLGARHLLPRAPHGPGRRPGQRPGGPVIHSPYFVPIAWTLGIILVLLLLIAVGWRNRKRRQSGVPAPFQDFADTEVARFEGMYVATTRGEDWLDRIAVHQLGVRTNADLVIGERGVHFM